MLNQTLVFFFHNYHKLKKILFKATIVFKKEKFIMIMMLFYIDLKKKDVINFTFRRMLNTNLNNNKLFKIIKLNKWWNLLVFIYYKNFSKKIAWIFNK